MGLTYSEKLVLWRSSLSCISHLVPQKKKSSQKKEAPLALYTFLFNFRTGLLFLQIFTKKELATFFKYHNSALLLSATHGKQRPANNTALVFRGNDC